jgi:two-component system, NarL family, response regulator NreC
LYAEPVNLLPLALKAPTLTSTRIILADDHLLIRAGLRRLLEQHPNFKVVGEAKDGREAVELVLNHGPDVAVLDVGMPELNGIEATRQIVSARPLTGVVILTMHCDEGYLLKALKAGARGYILKDSTEDDFINAIRSVVEGKFFFWSAISRILADDYVRRASRIGKLEVSEDVLPSREREVLQLLVQGKTTKEIADILHASAPIIDGHLQNILKTLDLRSMPELILYAVRRGIIS